MNRIPCLPRFRFLLTAFLVAVALVAMPLTARAATHVVGTSQDLATALGNAVNGDIIQLSATINYGAGIFIENKTITFDLNGFDLNVTNSGGHALEVGSGGVVNLDTSSGGSFNVTSGGNTYHCVYAHDGGKATVTSAMSYRSDSTGAYAASGGQITIGNIRIDDFSANSFGAWVDGAGSLINVTGDVTAKTLAVRADNGGEIHIGGKLTANSGVDARRPGTIVSVEGDIVLTGTSYWSRAVLAGDGATVTVGGNADGTCPVGVYAYGAGSTITVAGNVKTVYDGGVGAHAKQGSMITIRGTISAAVYINLDEVGRTAAEGVNGTGEDAGYKIYSNVSGSTVKVKNNPPAERSPVPTQSVIVGETTTFVASAIAEDVESDTLTITAIVTDPAPATATASLDSGTVTLTGIGEGSTSLDVTVSDGVDTRDITVPVSVTIPVAPSIDTHPSDQAVTEGNDATFTVVATGTEPLSYQWKKDGNNLSNGGRISGASTATLTVSDVQVSDAGSYSCTVSNASGNVSSDAATLTVVGFDVAVSGSKVAGQPFALSISNATDINGNKLSGSVNVTITSDQAADGQVHNESVDFTNGSATVNVTLNTVGSHTLTVSVDGMPASETVSVNVTTGGQPSGGGGSSSTRPPAAKLTAGQSRMTLSTSVNRSARSTTVSLSTSTLDSAFEGTGAGSDGVRTVVVEMPRVEGTRTYGLQMPAEALTSEDADRRVEMVSNIGSLSLPGNMLMGLGYEGTEKVGVAIGSADKSVLPEEVRGAVGDRPVVQLSMTVDGERREWNNPDAPVTVSIPYTPSPEELEDPEHITVWYIDGEGNAHAVTSGRYDPETGTVTFTVTHFSDYAVVYVEKTFGDLEDAGWAKEQVEVLASKGILRGVTETEYQPAEPITRADFLYSLVRALGVNARFEENFDDVPADAYYFEELGVARKLGIAQGVGDNKFDPTAGITRQDMMVLTERALRMLGRLEQQGSAADLERFSDCTSVAPYATESVASLVNEGLIQGDGERLNPLGGTARAEAAVFLYRIYSSR